MSLAPYRRVLARPGVRALLVLAVLARIPITAAPVVLTLHVVLDLGRGFAASGLLAAAFAVGGAIGAPLLGRAVDRVGLRPVLVVTTAVDGAFWLTAPVLRYEALLGAAVVGGLLAIPIWSLTRQALAAMAPPAERQAAFSLDSMSVELSFAIGPALGIVLLTATSSTVTLLTAAVLIIGSGIALTVLDPPVHGEEGVAAVAGSRPRPSVRAVPVRSWLRAPVAAVLLVTFATTFTVVGTDTALTAVMRDFDAVPLLGIVFAIWCLASLVGGFVYGASGRRVSPPAMLALLAALCLPVVFAQNWWTLALLVIPTGLFCAPLISLTAEELTHRTPAGVRGLVMGVHGSALTVGNAIGAPVIGLVVDAGPPRFGFVAIGVLGLALAAVSVVASRDRGPRSGAGQQEPRSGPGQQEPRSGPDRQEPRNGAGEQGRPVAAASAAGLSAVSR